MPPEGARPTAVTERSSGRVTTVDSAMAKGGKRLSKVAQLEREKRVNAERKIRDSNIRDPIRKKNLSFIRYKN